MIKSNGADSVKLNNLDLSDIEIMIPLVLNQHSKAVGKYRFDQAYLLEDIMFLMLKHKPFKTDEIFKCWL